MLGLRAALRSVGSNSRRRLQKRGTRRTPEPTELKEEMWMWILRDMAMQKSIVRRGEGAPGDVDEINLTILNEDEMEAPSEEEGGDDAEIFTTLGEDEDLS